MCSVVLRRLFSLAVQFHERSPFAGVFVSRLHSASARAYISKAYGSNGSMSHWEGEGNHGGNRFCSAVLTKVGVVQFNFVISVTIDICIGLY